MVTVDTGRVLQDNHVDLMTPVSFTENSARATYGCLANAFIYTYTSNFHEN